MELEGLELTPAQVQAQRLNALQDDEETFGVHGGDRPSGASAPAAPSSSLSCGRLVCLAAGCAVLYGEFLPALVGPTGGSLGQVSVGPSGRAFDRAMAGSGGDPADGGPGSLALMDGDSTPGLGRLFPR